MGVYMCLYVFWALNSHKCPKHIIFKMSNDFPFFLQAIPINKKRKNNEIEKMVECWQFWAFKSQKCQKHIIFPFPIDFQICLASSTGQTKQEKYRNRQNGGLLSNLSTHVVRNSREGGGSRKNKTQNRQNHQTHKKNESEHTFQPNRSKQKHRPTYCQ